MKTFVTTLATLMVLCSPAKGDDPSFAEIKPHERCLVLKFEVSSAFPKNPDGMLVAYDVIKPQPMPLPVMLFYTNFKYNGEPVGGFNLLMKLQRIFSSESKMKDGVFVKALTIGNPRPVELKIYPNGHHSLLPGNSSMQIFDVTEVDSSDPICKHSIE